MAQESGYTEQESLRLQTKQRRLGFYLLFIGSALQWIPGDSAWNLVLGWPVAAAGALLCAQTLLGGVGWGLLSLFPLIGAPLALIGMLVQYWLRGGSESRSGRRYFLKHELLLILLAAAAFWGGLVWLRSWCEKWGCSFM